MKWIITKLIIMTIMPAMIVSCKSAPPTVEQRQQQEIEMNAYMSSHGHVITTQH